MNILYVHVYHCNSFLPVLTLYVILSVLSSLLFLFQWTVTSQACSMFSTIPVALYDTLGHEGVAYIINQSKRLVLIHELDKIFYSPALKKWGFSEFALSFHQSFHLSFHPTSPDKFSSHFSQELLGLQS